MIILHVRQCHALISVRTDFTNTMVERRKTNGTHEANKADRVSGIVVYEITMFFPSRSIRK